MNKIQISITNAPFRHDVYIANGCVKIGCREFTFAELARLHKLHVRHDYGTRYGGRGDGTLNAELELIHLRGEWWEGTPSRLCHETWCQFVKKLVQLIHLVTGKPLSAFAEEELFCVRYTGEVGTEYSIWRDGEGDMSNCPVAMTEAQADMLCALYPLSRVKRPYPPPDEKPAEPEQMYCVRRGLQCLDDCWACKDPGWTNKPQSMTASEASGRAEFARCARNDNVEILPYPPPEQPAEPEQEKQYYVKARHENGNDTYWGITVREDRWCNHYTHDNMNNRPMTYDQAEKCCAFANSWESVQYAEICDWLSHEKPVAVKFVVRCSCGCGQYFKDDGTHTANAERLEDAATFKTYSGAVIFHDQIRGTSVDEIVGFDKDGNEVE